ncbi:MAG: tyrosine-type recombinase/integrase [Patescibacteria group bacterium]|jgi:site-specific recombinase XerD
MATKLSGPSLKELINLYVEEYSKERNFLPRTIRGKREFFSRFLNFLGDQDFNLKTSREYLCSYLVSIGWQAISRANAQKRIKAFITFLFKRKIIKENWGLELEPITVREKFRDLPSLADAVKIIITGTEPSAPGVKGDNSINRQRKVDVRAALLFMADTCFRVAELRSITVKNSFLEGEHPYIVFTQKFGNEVPYFIPIQHVQELKNRVSQDVIFKVTEETLNRSLKRGAIKLGLPKITCQDLRRIYPMNLDSNGASAFQIKDAMRHKDIKTTQKYIKYSPNQVRVINETFHDRNRSFLPVQKVVDFALENLKRIIGDRLRIEINQSNEEWSIKLSK